MKIYKMNKISLTIQILIGGIIIPACIIFLLNYLFFDRHSDTNNLKVIIFLPFFLGGLLAITQYFLKIEIKNNKISYTSVFGKIVINWDELTKLEFKNYNKIILKGIEGKKLYCSQNIVNYKSLYLEIFDQIKLHGKVSITDKSFIDYIDTIKD